MSQTDFQEKALTAGCLAGYREVFHLLSRGPLTTVANLNDNLHIFIPEASDWDPAASDWLVSTAFRWKGRHTSSNCLKGLMTCSPTTPATVGLAPIDLMWRLNKGTIMLTPKKSWKQTTQIFSDLSIYIPRPVMHCDVQLCIVTVISQQLLHNTETYYVV